MDERAHDILQHLQTSQFRDISGTQIVATIPVSEGLVNMALSASLPPGAPVRSVAIHPEAGDRFSVRIVPRMSLLPAMTLRLLVEEQPRLPDSPVLVLRLVTLSGLFGLAGGAIAGMLPPGVRLDGERILVDLRTIAAQHGQARVLDYLTKLHVGTEDGRVVVHVEGVIN
ncbi:MAG: hypothetical protein H0W08_05495 [Acidobacteria bacterium]|nr:hypothetical protein [Acidobacteriota bacterium]